MSIVQNISSFATIDKHLNMFYRIKIERELFTLWLTKNADVLLISIKEKGHKNRKYIHSQLKYNFLPVTWGA